MKPPIYYDLLTELRDAFPQPVSDRKHDAYFVFLTHPDGVGTWTIKYRERSNESTRNKLLVERVLAARDAISPE